MAYKDDYPLVGANGDVYVAPVGTALPDALADLDATPWVKVGLISEDGVVWTPPTEDTTDIGAWQTPFPVRTLTTSLTTSVQFGMLEWDRETIPVALGGGTWDDTGTELVVYKPPAPGESIERALFIEVIDVPEVAGLYFPRARVTDRDDINFKRDEAAILSVTFAILGSSNADPYNLVFTKADFEPVGPGTLSTTGTNADADTGAVDVGGEQTGDQVQPEYTPEGAGV